MIERQFVILYQMNVSRLEIKDSRQSVQHATIIDIRMYSNEKTQ
jgi:hypothetical protein